MTDFLKALEDIAGARAITCDASDMEPWLTDWRGRYHGSAQALVSPPDTQTLARIVKLAAEHRVPIVPQGGNSGMVGGATPDGSGNAILLSMRRMDAIRGFDVQDRQIVAEAGVILQNLHGVAEEKGLRFPLTLGGKGSATVGGLISTNAGGTQVLRHGTMRALVHGVEAVLPDGSIYDGLSALKKDNRGYDLKHLLIGAEGTLGIVTAASLKLVKSLIDRSVVWTGLESTAKARELLLFLQGRAGNAMEGFEILPQHCLDNVLTHIPGTRAPLASAAPWHALIELVRDDASSPDPAQTAEILMGEAMERGLISDAVISASEAQAEAFWKIRDSIAEAERAAGPAMQHDISVPPAKMGAFIDHVAPLMETKFVGTRAIAFGHMGDGNIHFHVMAPPGSDAASWNETQGKQISAMMHDLVVKWDGSISAEHGIGQMKRGELARLSSPARINSLIAIKAAMDPYGIMNPGKLIPLASAPHTT
ncbi:FAD-binding oxidoreductase [Sphingorhabdus sp. Alg239-R122]|uniref:FAD-binding oxidoreductase n=1 Tax=Sphingorhabdus sp. Alg239-R122 TaxID=2305989 RepID=UPI0013DBAA25|nr:FAD-binding oxidoreductase [Sphingorhabdus sp. Alg239-R122]